MQISALQVPAGVDAPALIKNAMVQLTYHALPKLRHCIIGFFGWSCMTSQANPADNIPISG